MDPSKDLYYDGKGNDRSSRPDQVLPRALRARVLRISSTQPLRRRKHYKQFIYPMSAENARFGYTTKWQRRMGLQF